MMAKLGKPLPELHITVDELSQLDVDDLREILAGIDGPKFITADSKRGTKTLAVLISHEKWKTLNHNVPDLPDVNISTAEGFAVTRKRKRIYA